MGLASRLRAIGEPHFDGACRPALSGQFGFDRDIVLVAKIDERIEP